MLVYPRPGIVERRKVFALFWLNHPPRFATIVGEVSPIFPVVPTDDKVAFFHAPNEAREHCDVWDGGTAK